MADPLDAFLDRLAHLSVDDLSVLALTPPDPEVRAERMERVASAARRAGRGREVERAATLARIALVRSLSLRGYEPTWFGLNWGRPLSRSEDRALLLMAAQDAAVASVIEDLLSADDVGALRDPFELVASMSGTASSASPEIRGSRRRRAVASVVWLYAAGRWLLMVVTYLWSGLVALLSDHRDAG